MTHRQPRDDPERWSEDWAHRRQSTDALPLFDASASLEAGLAARDATAARHSAAIEALVPLARELASRAPDGITVANLRIAAVQRGLLTGAERGRELSYLGKVMESAGLVATGKYVRSSIVKAHGNLNQTWRLPRDASSRGDAA